MLHGIAFAFTWCGRLNGNVVNPIKRRHFRVHISLVVAGPLFIPIAFGSNCAITCGEMPSPTFEMHRCIVRLNCKFQVQLLEIIQKRLESCSNGFPAHVIHSDFPKPQHASTHILLFTSALVPKALASILTSFVFAAGSRVGYHCLPSGVRAGSG